MDRFIVFCTVLQQNFRAYLKSNMDRFIAVIPVLSLYAVANLKSNMDRFIVLLFAAASICACVFKIQYG